MISPDVMNSLLENRAFRAFLAARTKGIPGDSTEQRETAQHVTDQIEIVLKRKVGSFRYNLACAVLLQYITTYLTVYGETEPPYLPKGHEQIGSNARAFRCLRAPPKSFDIQMVLVVFFVILTREDKEGTNGI